MYVDKQKMQLDQNMQLDISEILGFYPDLFLQKSGGVFMLLHVYIKIVYYGAYKIANFYISAFSAFHHTSFYTKKSLHFRISVYFDHFIRVLYERRYASYMLHHHLCTVRYSGCAGSKK